MHPKFETSINILQQQDSNIMQPVPFIKAAERESEIHGGIFPPPLCSLSAVVEPFRKTHKGCWRNNKKDLMIKADCEAFGIFQSFQEGIECNSVLDLIPLCIGTQRGFIFVSFLGVCR